MLIYLRLEHGFKLLGDADVAQVVAHLIGSEEVTGPSPVISSLKMVGIWENPGSYFFVSN